jgi:hypothetical protein
MEKQRDIYKKTSTYRTIDTYRVEISSSRLVNWHLKMATTPADQALWGFSATGVEFPTLSSLIGPTIFS